MIDGDITNWAEISVDDGNDADSTPDTINDETTESPEDDTVENENGDEDDHDPATISVSPPVYDLALAKVVAAGIDVVTPGDSVAFEITVTNQGNMDATAIEIIDYIPV